MTNPSNLIILVIFTLLVYLNCFSVLICESKSLESTLNEIECFSQNKVYNVEKDKCYKLLTRGPCESGYWFVLEKPKSGINNQDVKISGICAKVN